MITPGIIHICNAWFLDTRISNCILFTIILATVTNFLLNSNLHCTYLDIRITHNYTYQSLLHYWTNYMNVWPKYILLRQHILHTLFFWSTDWVLLVTAFVPFLLNNPKSSTRWWENVHGESSWGLFFNIAISSLVSLSSNSLPLIISMLMKVITSVYLGI